MVIFKFFRFVRGFSFIKLKLSKMNFRSEIPHQYGSMLVFYSGTLGRFYSFYLEVHLGDHVQNVWCDFREGPNFVCFCLVCRRGFRIFWRISSRHHLRYRQIGSIHRGLYVLVPYADLSSLSTRRCPRTDPCLLTIICARVLVANGVTHEIMRARLPGLAHWGFEISNMTSVFLRPDCQCVIFCDSINHVMPRYSEESVQRYHCRNQIIALFLLFWCLIVIFLFLFF